MTPTAPNSEEVLDSILHTDVERSSVTVCVAANEVGEHLPGFQRLEMTDDLRKEFRIVVAKKLQGWAKERQEYQLVLWPHLDQTRPSPYEFEHIDLQQYEQIRRQLDALAQPLVGLPLFTADGDIVSGIRFYVIIIQEQGRDPIYFFRTYTPKRELSRSRWFAAWLTDGHFDKIKDPTFLFDDHVDCFSTGQHMFIVQKSNFQAIFQFFEMAVQAAAQTLAIIQTRIPIKNFDEFARDCQAHLQKLLKLKNISAQPYLDSISMKDLRSVISRLKLPIAIENVGGQEMLVYNRADRWALLRLLDDDYVQSLLTKRIYSTDGKRLLS